MGRKFRAPRALLLLACIAQAADRFIDTDGWFDATEFIDSRLGFVPILSPITEPAVGYGAAGALLFIERNGKQRPNIFAVGGLITENGTNGLFAGHLGTWLDGSLHSTVGVGGFDANLHFSGLGGDGQLSLPFDYGVRARGGIGEADHRIRQSPYWIGLRYLFADTRVRFDLDSSLIPDQLPDAHLQLGALTPSLTYDTRNNFFTPTHGLYLAFEYGLYRDFLGSDRNFDKPQLTGIWYHPLGDELFFGLRAAAKDSSDGTPFFLLPFVSLRGLEAMSVAGDRSIEAAAVSATCWRAASGCTWVSTSASDRMIRCSTWSSEATGYAREQANASGMNRGRDQAPGRVQVPARTSS